MAAHLRQLEDDFIRKGLPPEEARLAARRAFGGVEQAKEAQRDARSIRWLDELRQNVRYAIRTLRRAPGFTFVAVLTLALGIGANTVMFSIMNATMLQPLPFPEPERLAMLWQVSVRRSAPNFNIVSMPNYRDWLERSRSFESIGLMDSAGRGYNLTGEGQAERVPGLRVTASFFDVLGIPPMLGRTFLEGRGRRRPRPRRRPQPRLVDAPLRRRPGDRRQDHPDRRQGARRRRRHAARRSSSSTAAAASCGCRSAGRKAIRDRTSNSFIAIGRLKPGVTMEQARSEMDTIGRALSAEYPVDNANQTVRRRAR